MKQHQYTALADIAQAFTLVFATIACIACIIAMASPLFCPDLLAPFIGAFIAFMALAYVSEVVSQWLHERAYRMSSRF